MRRERGVGLVEAAFVLPLLFLLIMGTVDFGIVYGDYQALTQAARAGARFAVAPLPGTGAPAPPNPPQSPQAIAQVVCSYLVGKQAPSMCSTYNGTRVPPTVATCVISGGSVPVADDVYVTQCSQTLPSSVTYWYTEVDIRMTVKLPMLPSIPLHTTAAMRNETN